jgi:hypothetical protein
MFNLAFCFALPFVCLLCFAFCLLFTRACTHQVDLVEEHHIGALELGGQDLVGDAVPVLGGRRGGSFSSSARFWLLIGRVPRWYFFQAP